MESFSLLKYWRGGGGASMAASALRAPSAAASAAAAATTTIAASALRPSAESSDDDTGDDDGPFFDLEFAAVPDDDGNGDDDNAGGENFGGSDDEEVEEKEFNFMVTSDGVSGDGVLRSDPVSPSDDLFFKGKLVPLETNSIVITSEGDAKPHFPVAFRKSATRFRVFLLGLRRAKSAAASSPAATEVNAAAGGEPAKQQSKFFIKFRVEEVRPIASLFSSSKGSGSGAKKPPAEESAATAEEKKFAKEVVTKYLSKIKPLYVKVSKRYGEKLRFSGQLSSATGDGEEKEPVAEPPPPASGGVKTQIVSNIPAGLKVVCKRLGKSRSASSAVAAVPSPPPPPAATRRRDDSLLQQQDGIQSAIAHCKRSFDAPKGSESPLVRSMSDPGDGRAEKGKGECV